jgi:hypothetical protein
MFRLRKITIIRLRISVAPREDNHLVIAMRQVIKLTAEISSFHKIFGEITFGKNFSNMYNYYKILLFRKKA